MSFRIGHKYVLAQLNIKKLFLNHSKTLNEIKKNKKFISDFGCIKSINYFKINALYLKINISKNFIEMQFKIKKKC